MIDLNKPVQFVKNVGPTRVKLLNKLNIFTLNDLITYFPRNYEDRGIAKKLSNCVSGEEALIKATAVTKVLERFAGKLKIYTLVVKEDGENPCTIIWYNQSYVKSIFKIGHTYNFFGKIEIKSGKFEMKSPIFDEDGQNKNTGKIIPIYPLTYGITQNTIRKIIENGVNEIYGKLEESMPNYILNKYKLMPINEAIKNIHFPKTNNDFKLARYRLVFEELLTLQLALLNLKQSYKCVKNGIEFNKDVKMSDVINTLTFNLTKAQLRVLEEIDTDMESKKNMNRLLQGDVGSGKTIVSEIAAYKAVKSGYQVAILAPTAILAEQHLENFKKTLDKFEIRCELLISSITKKNKEKIKQRLQNRGNRHFNRNTCNARRRCNL